MVGNPIEISEVGEEVLAGAPCSILRRFFSGIWIIPPNRLQISKKDSVI